MARRRSWPTEEEIAAWVAEQLAKAPPPTEEQIALIRRVMGPLPWPGSDTEETGDA